MTLRGLLTLAIAVAALLATGTVAAADSSPAAGRRPPAATLHLTVTADIGITADATLTCVPSGGSHPNAARACFDLTMAAGDLDRLAARPLNCPMIYQRVTATAQGTWRGKGITWQRTFPNSCLIWAATGAVFRF